MRPALRVASCAGLAWAIVASGQPVSSGDCTRDAKFYERAGYRLAEDVEFRGGFSFVRFIRRLADPADHPDLRKGAAFNTGSLLDFKDRLQARLGAASEERVHFSFVEVYIDRCSSPDSPNPELHANVRVFDSSPPVASFRLFESRRNEISDPVQAARIAGRVPTLRLSPQAGFNPSDEAFAGGTLAVAADARLFSNFTAEGFASRTASRVNAEFSGERTWESAFLESAAWHFGFLRNERPTGEGTLAQSEGYARLLLVSRPLGELQTVLRFATEAGGGYAQTDLAQRGLPANTLANSGNQMLKNAVGVTTRAGVHSFSFSYGLQLGRTGHGRTVDYHKHLADIAFSTYRLVGDHKLLEWETRFGAGALKVPGLVPAAERFFGGNRETSFFAGPDLTSAWSIRSNPTIRGIPANQLNRIVAGPVTGGEGFLAWTNTVALPVPFANYPLLPATLTQSDEFNNALTLQRNANRSALIVSYTSQDPAFRKATTLIPAIDAELVRLRTTVQEIAKTDISARVAAEDCATVIRDRRAILEEAAEAMDIVISDDDSAVIAPVLACAEKVRTAHPDSSFEPALTTLRHLREEVASELKKIDTAHVEKLADQDMRLANRIMDVFFKEASLISVRPIVLFDVARLAGPLQAPDWLGVRYSIGGGLRAQFLRVLNATGGYAANPRRRPGEAAGAFFFSLEFLDLFR